MGWRSYGGRALLASRRLVSFPLGFVVSRRDKRPETRWRGKRAAPARVFVATVTKVTALLSWRPSRSAPARKADTKTADTPAVGMGGGAGTFACHGEAKAKQDFEDQQRLKFEDVHTRLMACDHPCCCNPPSYNELRDAVNAASQAMDMLRTRASENASENAILRGRLREHGLPTVVNDDWESHDNHNSTLRWHNHYKAALECAEAELAKKTDELAQLRADVEQYATDFKIADDHVSRVEERNEQLVKEIRELREGRGRGKGGRGKGETPLPVNYGRGKGGKGGKGGAGKGGYHLTTRELLAHWDVPDQPASLGPVPTAPPGSTVLGIPAEQFNAMFANAHELPQPDSLKPGSLIRRATHGPSREDLLQNLNFDDLDAQPRK